jgi:small GTP-binding protein
MSCFKPPSSSALFEEGDLSEIARYFHHLYKITMFGDCGVGKSRLLTHVSGQPFATEYSRTVGVAFANKRISVPDTSLTGFTTITLQVWDTSGHETYRDIVKSYSSNQGIVLVFDVTSEESFLHIDGWASFIRIDNLGSRKVILLGNKCDMVEQRVISKERAQECADRLGISLYMDVSAMSGMGVDTAFAAITHLLML